MMIDKQVTNSKAIAIFKDKVFSGIYNAYDISNDEKLLKCKIPPSNRESFDGEAEAYLKGYELKDNIQKKTFLLPSNITLGNGVKKHISAIAPLKIKDSMEVYHGKKVYHWVSGANIKSVNYPEDNSLSMADFIDYLFPIEHSNPKDLQVLRFALLSSHIGGFTRCIGDKGFGKDGVANTLIGISSIGNNISKVSSDAKLMKLIDDKYTVFNEISGFSGERLEMIESFFLGTGDVNTEVYNHSTTGNEMTGNKRDITKYSYSIIHNPPMYYIGKGKLTFEQMFQPAVFDRFLPLKLEGQVMAKNSFQDPSIDFNKVVDDNMTFYKLFIGKLMVLRNNAWKQRLKYSIERYKLSFEGRSEASSRWMNTFIRIAQLVQLYAEDKAIDTNGDAETIFYEQMDLIYDSHKRAVNEIIELGLIGLDGD